MKPKRKHKAFVEQLPDGWFRAVCMDTGSHTPGLNHPDYDNSYEGFVGDRELWWLQWCLPCYGIEHEHI